MVKPPTRWLVPSHGELLNPAKMRNNVISKIDCEDQFSVKLHQRSDSLTTTFSPS